MAELSGYGAESAREKAERETREKIYGSTPRNETSKSDPKEKR